jgi:hypothetical protein
VSCNGGKRESDGEGGALTFLAMDLDGAPVLLDDLPGAGQADPLAGEPADDIGRAVVALEDARQIRGRDPDAAVAHPDTGTRAAPPLNG